MAQLRVEVLESAMWKRLTFYVAVLYICLMRYAAVWVARKTV